MCLSTDMLTLSSSVSRESRTFLLTKQSFTLPTNLSQDILLFLKARQSCGVPLVIHGDRSESWHRNFCIGLLDHKSLHKKVRDSRDTDDDNVSISVDRHIKGFINNAFYIKKHPRLQLE